jgi:hypothetical protein
MTGHAPTEAVAGDTVLDRAAGGYVVLPYLSSLIAKKKAHKLYYDVVDSARVDGQPRIVHQTYLGTAEKLAAIHRVCEPGPKTDVAAWCDRTILPALWHLPATRFTSQAFCAAEKALRASLLHSQ